MESHVSTQRPPMSPTQLDAAQPSRYLLRLLRTHHRVSSTGDELPESVLWRAYCELRRRGEDDAQQYFLRSVRKLHHRRSIRGTVLPTDDQAPDEHKLVDDPMLAELWKAYKRCICSQRIGPASQLLNDIEAQILRH